MLRKLRYLPNSRLNQIINRNNKKIINKVGEKFNANYTEKYYENIIPNKVIIYYIKTITYFKMNLN